MGPRQENDSTKTLAEEETALLQPFEYVRSVPGKNIRKMLLKAFNGWLDISSEHSERITDIIDMLHNSSLLIDDIQDNSDLRRGVPTAHRIFGAASTINSANYVCLLALDKCLAMGEKAARVFSEQILELHRGQGMDLYWRENLICPTVAEYELMVQRKTGGLFSLAVRLMQVASTKPTANEDYSKLNDLLGLYFQIRDDYQNLMSDEYAKQKTYCEDLTEGKFSFPIVHAIHTAPRDGRISNILRQRTHDDDLKKQAVAVLESLGSLEYTLQRLKELHAACYKEIERLGGNPALLTLVDRLKVW